MLTAWQEEHILDERREHVPGFKVHKRADEKQSICGRERYCNLSEGSVVLDKPVCN